MFSAGTTRLHVALVRQRGHLSIFNFLVSLTPNRTVRGKMEGQVSASDTHH